MKALNDYGRDWKRVAREVQTRTSTQCRSHAQKFIVSLEKQGITLEDALKNDFCLLTSLKGLREEGYSQSNESEPKD